MNGENIGGLIDQIESIERLDISRGDKRKKKGDAIRLYSETVFDAARDTYPMDTTPLYKNHEDYFKNS